MNFTKVICGGALISLALFSTGCKSLNDALNSKSSTNKKNKQETVLPRDREQIATTKSYITYTSEDIKKGEVKGDWAIETVNGKEAVGEKAPYLRFSPSEKMVYGNNGCNYIHGSYRYDPSTKSLSFGDMASTMMMCGLSGITDTEINVALSQVTNYSWEARDNEYYLFLYDAEGNDVITLMHQNFDFLNGTWAVKEIEDTPIDDPDMKMVIDVDEGKIHGNTGCNRFNGSLEIDMEEANSISFSSFATTRMACPEGSHETALLIALEEASTAKPISKDEVLLFSAGGNQVLRLVRTTDE
ncbi:MAG: META domain-containing protein [Muribaculaceae bacterium]|nr:META domain-containing protein [Muribaculaceae bacterium]